MSPMGGNPPDDVTLYRHTAENSQRVDDRRAGLKAGVSKKAVISDRDPESRQQIHDAEETQIERAEVSAPEKEHRRDHADRRQKDHHDTDQFPERTVGFHPMRTLCGRGGRGLHIFRELRRVKGLVNIPPNPIQINVLGKVSSLDRSGILSRMKAELTSSEQQLAETLKPALQAVESHPVFGAVQTEKQLRSFMEHHVFPVWDFMSLLKFLQAELAPATWPWMPRPHGDLVRLINDIVTGEESDRLPKSHRDNSTHASHFDLYLMAMREVGADTSPITAFLDIVRLQGLEAALEAPIVPEPSRAFMQDTFALLKRGEAHRIAASFSFGRENVIPGMFNSLLTRLGIGEERAPIFHYYLKRHAELDGDEHGPAALRLVATLCGDDPAKLAEAVESAKEALASRARLWDSVQTELSA